MHIIISNSSPIPIYEQIKNTIIEQIQNNELQEDEMLPSIRSLAKDIKISLMTIKKAYDELENEGYLISIQGKGTYVAKRNIYFVQEQIQKDIEEHLTKVCYLAKKNNISLKEIKDLVDIIYEGEIWKKSLKLKT